MTNFRWEEPPKKRSGRNAKAYKDAKRLASRPGKWARIADYKTYQSAATRAYAIRNGEIKAWNDVGTFEAKVRQVSDSEFGLWARCVYVKKEKTDGFDE